MKSQASDKLSFQNLTVEFFLKNPLAKIVTAKMYKKRQKFIGKYIKQKKSDS